MPSFFGGIKRELLHYARFFCLKYFDSFLFLAWQQGPFLMSQTYVKNMRKMLSSHLGGTRNCSFALLHFMFPFFCSFIPSEKFRHLRPPKKALKNSRVLRQHSGGALPLYNERQNLFAGDGKTSFGPFHHNSFSSSYGGGRGGNNPIMLHILYVCMCLRWP